MQIIYFCTVSLCNICQITSSFAFAARSMSAIHGQFSIVGRRFNNTPTAVRKEWVCFALSARALLSPLSLRALSLSARSQTITITLLQEPHKSTGELHTHALGGGRAHRWHFVLVVIAAITLSSARPTSRLPETKKNCTALTCAWILICAPPPRPPVWDVWAHANLKVRTCKLGVKWIIRVRGDGSVFNSLLLWIRVCECSARKSIEEVWTLKPWTNVEFKVRSVQ